MRSSLEADNGVLQPENAKNTLCRNVTIYGSCRFEDKGKCCYLLCALQADEGEKAVLLITILSKSPLLLELWTSGQPYPILLTAKTDLFTLK